MMWDSMKYIARVGTPFHQWREHAAYLTQHQSQLSPGLAGWC